MPQRRTGWVSPSARFSFFFSSLVSSRWVPMNRRAAGTRPGDAKRKKTTEEKGALDKWLHSIPACFFHPLFFCASFWLACRLGETCLELHLVALRQQANGDCFGLVRQCEQSVVGRPSDKTSAVVQRTRRKSDDAWPLFFFFSMMRWKRSTDVEVAEAERLGRQRRRQS